jgi:hypothetical protein
MQPRVIFTLRITALSGLCRCMLDIHTDIPSAHVPTSGLV